MTFSSSVKSELYGLIPNSSTKALSEVMAILSILKSVVDENNGKISFWIENENRNIIEYTKGIFTKYIDGNYITEFDDNNFFTKDGKFIFTLTGSSEDYFLRFIKNMRDICLKKYDNFIDKKSFIKGMFLVCGSVSNPENGYHLEFVFQSMDLGNYFMKCLNYYNLNSKIIKRKKCYTVYIKESDNISKLFSIMEAYNGVLKFEDVRVKKEYSNNKNRLKNCIEANEDKLIIASVRQVQAIMLVDEAIGLEKLPKNLREVAEVRLKHKEMPLKDLGKFLSPPIGKSGVSHRLRKIEEIAEKFKK